MNEEILISNGWDPKPAMIGTLYFKGRFFCNLKDDEAFVYSVYDDMYCIGIAKSIEDMFEIEKKYDLDQIRLVELNLKYLKKEYKEKYGETL